MRPDKDRLASEWLSTAAEDLRVARLLIDGSPSRASFFAQPAAEKAVTAVCVARIDDAARTHVINHLLDELVANDVPVGEPIREGRSSERPLAEAGLGDSADIERASAVGGGLGLFVRSLVGLDRKAVATAFGEFPTGRTLTADQLEFVNTLIDHLTARGVVDPEMLYASAFTDIDPMGVSGVFSDADASKIVDVLATVRKNDCARANSLASASGGRRRVYQFP